MKKWVQQIAIWFLQSISKLPFSIFYVLSDALSALLTSVVPYRKQVIEQNLFHSFPNFSVKQLKHIRNQFYHYFSDLLVETIKSYSISKEQLEQKIEYKNVDLIEEYSNNKQPIIVAMAHYGNWELFGLAGYMLPFHTYSLYRKQKSALVNQFIITNRQRYGLQLIEEKQAVRTLPKLLTEQQPNLITFIADQAVSPKRGLWIQFLNRPATFVKGMETYARKYNCPVFYLDVTVPQRGKYEGTFQLLHEQPSQLQTGELTKLYAQQLEQTISNQPPYWLWSHRKWKHSLPSPEELI